MMIKKKLGVLAAAVAVASTANAAFEEGNAVLYAWDSADNDTYFVDLGVIDLTDGGQYFASDAGLAAWLDTQSSVEWAVVQTVNDTTAVGGPPALGQSLLDSGIVSTSTGGSAVGTDGTTNGQQQDTLNAWLAQVEAASGGSSSFSVAGTDPEAAGPARNGGGFGDSMIALDATSDLFYSQANPADGATLADANVVTAVGAQGTLSASLTSTGDIQVNAVPVPAAAWLFGSALAGLSVVRRRKS